MRPRGRTQEEGPPQGRHEADPAGGAGVRVRRRVFPLSLKIVYPILPCIVANS